MASDAASEATADNALNVRGLLISTGAILLGIMLVMVVVGQTLQEPLERVSRQFVDTLGGLGVALGFFLPDAFNLPLPADAFTTLGIAGGMSFVEVVLWGTAGSWVGGAIGYWIGRGLRHTRWVRRVLESRGGRVQRLLTKHGAVAVAVAALTPLPYSIFCWGAGAGRLPFRVFLAISLLRIVRVAGYLLVIQVGLGG